MLPAKDIMDSAHQLIHKYGTRDPMKIVEQSSIMLSYSGDLQTILGLYLCRWKHRIIILNASMDGETETMVLAHELGHDALHRTIARSTGLEEKTLFQMNTSTEYEANAFAAHLLLPSQTIFDYVRNYEYDPWKIACALHTNVQLVLVKLQELNRMGYHFQIPMNHNSSFFQSKPGSETDEWHIC